jgi:hypothetical protein
MCAGRLISAAIASQPHNTSSASVGWFVVLITLVIPFFGCTERNKQKGPLARIARTNLGDPIYNEPKKPG